MQICTYKVTFVLKRPTTDERHSCNDFPKTLFCSVKNSLWLKCLKCIYEEVYMWEVVSFAIKEQLQR